MARKPLRPLVRGGGYYPSRKWTPLVYAGGYTTASGGEEPAPPPIEKTITGNPIHITDALAKPVQALSVKLEPIQDLNGYDNPWPAGGGKNLYNADAIPNSSSGGITATVNNGVITLNGTATSNSYFTVSNTGLSVGTYKFSFNNAIANSDVRVSFRNSDGKYFADAACDRVNKTLAISNDEPQMVIIYIKSGAVLTNYVIKPQLEVGTAATDFAPFANICPISGWTECKVTRTGVNVWDEEAEQGTLSTVNGSDVVKTTRIRSKNYISVVPNKTYYFRIGSAETANGLLVCFYDIGKNFISGAWQISATVTMPSNAYYVRFSTGDVYGGTYNNDISINYPSTDHDYHAYVGTTYPIPLGQTVYGGTLDVVTGVLTVTMAMVDLGTLNWSKSTYATVTMMSCSVASIVRTSGQPVPAISSIYEASDDIWSSRTLRDKIFSINYAGTYIYVYDSAFTDATAFKAAMSGQTLVYALAEPVIIPLTLDTPIELLEGENNIWSDGTMTLVYLADGNASDVEALNILLGNRYVNNHGEDEPTDREALDIVLGGKK